MSAYLGVLGVIMSADEKSISTGFPSYGQPLRNKPDAVTTPLLSVFGIRGLLISFVFFCTRAMKCAYRCLGNL